MMTETRILRQVSRDGISVTSLLILDTEDGLSACPICSARMKEEAVFAHLDIHNGSDDISKVQSISTR